MEIRYAFNRALKKARKSQGLTQEDFSSVSSRTYLSTLERAQKSPTFDKIHMLSQTIGIHFLSILTLACLYFEHINDIGILFSRIKNEIEKMDTD